MRKFDTEKDLAKIVVAMLQEWGWEVYQEVRGNGGRCDIVGSRGKLLWAIECKLSFGLPIIEQASKWIWQAHYVSIATPNSPSAFGEQILRHYGIGSISFRGSEDYFERVRPRLNRKIHPIKLHEEQKYYAEAGTNGGGYYTPFKKTVNALILAVNHHPGIEFNKLIKEIDHHYQTLSTAKSCLRGFIGSSVIPQLRCEITDRRLCVFPVEKSMTPDELKRMRGEDG
jgi:hypothetical protein